MPSVREKTILVIDDEEFIRDIMKLHLEKEGYNVVLSKDGEEAISALKNHDISVALTDIKMPKIDGFSVLEYIKEHYGHVPVIMMTGYGEVNTAVHAMKKGAIDYLTKPIKKRALLDTIDLALKSKESSKVSKPFEPTEIYLMKDDGMVICHQDIGNSSEIDYDMFGSMFTAIKMFIKDSFYQDGEELRAIEHGRFKILIEEGANFFLVVIGQGDKITPIREKMQYIIQNINKNYKEAFINWDGNMNPFNGIEKELDVLTGTTSSFVS